MPPQILSIPKIMSNSYEKVQIIFRASETFKRDKNQISIVSIEDKIIRQSFSIPVYKHNIHIYKHKQRFRGTKSFRTPVSRDLKRILPIKMPHRELHHSNSSICVTRAYFIVLKMVSVNFEEL